MKFIILFLYLLYLLYFYDITLIIPYTLYFFLYSTKIINLTYFNFILSEKVESNFRVLLKIIQETIQRNYETYIIIYRTFFIIIIFIPTILSFNFSINFGIHTRM